MAITQMNLIKAAKHAMTFVQHAPLLPIALDAFMAHINLTMESVLILHAKQVSTEQLDRHCHVMTVTLPVSPVKEQANSIV